MDVISLPSPTLSREERAARRRQQQLARTLWRQNRRKDHRRHIEEATERITGERCGGFWLYPNSAQRLAENDALLLARIEEVRRAGAHDLPPYALGLELPDYLLCLK
jgi:hypothetical protein